MDENYLSPNFYDLDDAALSWKHYISPQDIAHWDEYPKELKRMLYNLANNMMHHQVDLLDRGRIGE